MGHIQIAYFSHIRLLPLAALPRKARRNINDKVCVNVLYGKLHVTSWPLIPSSEYKNLYKRTLNPFCFSILLFFYSEEAVVCTANSDSCFMHLLRKEVLAIRNLIQFLCFLVKFYFLIWVKWLSV